MELREQEIEQISDIIEENTRTDYLGIDEEPYENIDAQKAAEALYNKGYRLMSAPASLDECRLTDEDEREELRGRNFLTGNAAFVDTLLLGMTIGSKAQLHSPKLSAYITAREEAARKEEREEVLKELHTFVAHRAEVTQYATENYVYGLVNEKIEELQAELKPQSVKS